MRGGASVCVSWTLEVEEDALPARRLRAPSRLLPASPQPAGPNSNARSGRASGEPACLSRQSHMLLRNLLISERVAVSPRRPQRSSSHQTDRRPASSDSCQTRRRLPHCDITADRARWFRAHYSSRGVVAQPLQHVPISGTRIAAIAAPSAPVHPWLTSSLTLVHRRI